ncbi:apolipoprotein N-acyltransferase [Shewanella cyperi]|uniref:apolipoprotein N-acyltransferase n=1 Tax=Shewanella cyperi TaxID=2814292 RepID=UPI001A9404D1|nr:apolipoprotein N-acyltransferase [Shewanella cyperi]QSX39925.1 apolipoprotein N-acyltransferase [Shewanella cyperi]
MSPLVDTVRQSRIRLPLAFLAGASTALAFAPYGLWPFYPLALVFCLWLGRQLGPAAAFRHWLSFGFGAFVFGISWVHVSIDRYGGLPLPVSLGLMALLAFYLALYPALVGAAFAKLKSGRSYFDLVGLFPALWMLAELGRGSVMTGFPWLLAGYSQTDGPLAPLASVIGVEGLSLLLMMCVGALLLFVEGKRLPLLLLLPLLALATWAAQAFSPLQSREESVKVLLVQGNIPQSMKWRKETLWPSLLKHLDMTRPNFDVDIVVWPEAAVPIWENVVSDFLDNANRAANLTDTAIITGIISHPEQEFYNSLIVLGNHFNKQQDAPDYQIGDGNDYRKHHLLPIGEFVPFEDLLRPLAPLFNLPMSSFNRGDFIQPNLQAVGYRLAPAICYEIAFPEQLRANFSEQTDLLLTVSNDAWFGESNGPLQHMEIARMRAIELGRPLLRATNNGVTAVVDEHGKMVKQLPQFEAAVLKADVPLVKGQTLFARFGHAPVLALMSLLLLAGIGLSYRRR